MNASRTDVRRKQPVLAEALEIRRLFTDPSGLSISVNGTPVANDPATTIDLTSSLANGGSAKIVVSNVTSSPIDVSEAIAVPGLTISPAIADQNAFNSNLTTFTIAGGASQTFTLRAGSTPGSFLDPVRFQTATFDFYQFTLAASISGAKQTPPISASDQVSVADQADTSGLQFVGNTNEETYFGLTASESNLTIALNDVTDNGEFSSTPELNVQLISDANSNGILDSSELSGPSLLDKQVATGGSNHSFVVQGVPAGAYFVYVSPTVSTLSTQEQNQGAAIITYAFGLTAAAITPGISVTATANGAAIANGQSTASSANDTSFGTVQPGASPIVEQYTVKNTGNGQLDLSNLQVSGSGFDVESQLPATLAAQASATFSIGLLSSGSGEQNGTVSFDDNVSGQSPFTFAVSGTVAAPTEPGLEVLEGSQQINNGQSSAIFLGNVQSGGLTIVQQFTINNTGTGVLDLGNLQVSGSGFAVESQPPATIAAQGSATFSIGLLSNGSGPQNATVSFTDNVSGQSPFTFPVSGNVTAANTPEPSVKVLNGSQQIANDQLSAISFGSLPEGAPPPTQTFTVQNLGTSNLTIGPINVPPGFALTSGISAAIPPQGSASFTVQMNTTVAGSPAGSVSFTTNDPNAPNFSFVISGTVSSGVASQGLSIASVTTQKIASSVVGGQKISTGVALVTLQNISGATLTGSAAVTVFASPASGAVAGGSLKLGQGGAKIKLKTGQSQVVKIKVAFPAVSANGIFFVVAQATGAGITSGASVIATALNTVNVLAPFVSLQGPGAGGTLSATPGRPLSFSILLKNQGDVTAAGSINLNPLLSTDRTLATATALPSVPAKISIKPNAGKSLKLKVTLPAATPAGSDVLLLKLQSNGALATLNLLDGQVVATFPVNVV